MAANKETALTEKKERYINPQRYRRPLPACCIAFGSGEGKLIFKEALMGGYMEVYFRLAAQFRTQEEPAFCGISTMTMVLNALEVDPGRPWKGIFRWYDEKMLDCCHSYDYWEQQGITFNEWKCLATCNGLDILQAVRGSEPGSEDTLRAAVKKSCSTDDSVVVVTYDREGVGQIGSGHFSPIGGYHPGRDLVLILDVARFKYPPHWVKLSTLHAATLSIDKVTKKSRGFLTVKKSDAQTLIMFRLNTKQRQKFAKTFKLFSARLQKNLSNIYWSSTGKACSTEDGDSGGSSVPSVIQPCVCAELLVSAYVASFSSDETSLIVRCISPFAKQREDSIFEFHGFAIESVSRQNKEMIHKLVEEIEATKIFSLVKDNLIKLGLMHHSKTTSGEQCPCGDRGTEAGAETSAFDGRSAAKDAEMNCGAMTKYSLSAVHLMVVFLLLWINQKETLQQTSVLCCKSMRELFPAFCSNNLVNRVDKRMAQKPDIVGVHKTAATLPKMSKRRNPKLESSDAKSVPQPVKQDKKCKCCTGKRKLQSSVPTSTAKHVKLDHKDHKFPLLAQEIRTLLIQLRATIEHEVCCSSCEREGNSASL